MFKQKPYVIGIVGSSGSGKTFFLKCFLNHFKEEEITLISQDDYYIPANTKTQEENKLYNFDVPSAIDREQFYRDIASLFSGQAVSKQEYTFNNPKIRPKTLKIKPAPILIVEGLFILHFEEINEMLDERIFLHADEDVALERRLKRDLLERGYSDEDVRYKWFNHVLPSFNYYLFPYRYLCNRVIENNQDDPLAMMKITDEISDTLKKKLNG